MIDIKPAKVTINPAYTQSFILLQPQTLKHNHRPVKVVTYYNNEAIVSVRCQDCKQELVKKIYKWTDE